MLHLITNRFWECSLHLVMYLIHQHPIKQGHTSAVQTDVQLYGSPLYDIRLLATIRSALAQVSCPLFTCYSLEWRRQRLYWQLVKSKAIYDGSAHRFPPTQNPINYGVRKLAVKHSNSVFDWAPRYLIGMPRVKNIPPERKEYIFSI